MSAAQDALNLAQTMQTTASGGGVQTEREFQLNVCACLILLAEAALSTSPSTETVAADVTTASTTDPVSEVSPG